MKELNINTSFGFLLSIHSAHLLPKLPLRVYLLVSINSMLQIHNIHIGLIKPWDISSTTFGVKKGFQNNKGTRFTLFLWEVCDFSIITFQIHTCTQLHLGLESVWMCALRWLNLRFFTFPPLRLMILAGGRLIWVRMQSGANLAALSPSFFLFPLGPLGAGRGSYSFTAIIINIQLIQEVGRMRLDAVKSSAYSKQQP